MKRFITGIVIVLVVGSAASHAFAQTDEYFRRPHHIALSLDGGLGTPAQPAKLKDLWNTGWPFSATLTASVFSWLEIGGGFTYARFGISENKAKAAVRIIATSEITGGDIKLMEYFGLVRFIAVPNQRTNPYAEFRLGASKISADNLEVGSSASGPEIFPGFSNEMPDANAGHFSAGGGLRYALTDYWSAYAKYIWTMNLGNTFAPGDLVRPDGAEPTEGENMQFGAFIVGIMIRM
jgi:opacity protein-like surface antigen